MKDKKKELSVFEDEGGYVELFDYLLREVGNVCLEGESGCGKTQLVHDYCDAMKIKLLETSLTSQTTRWELIASDTLEAGNTKIRKGIVAEWLMTTPEQLEKEGYTGVMMYWDGFNYASPDVTALLESLADFRGSIRIYELGQVLKRSPKHYFVISMNPYEKAGYVGTFASNIAQRRRFEVIRMTWLSVPAEVDLVERRTGVDHAFARRIVEFASKTRNAYREGVISAPITTGNVINYCKLYKAGLSENQIIRIATGQYLEEEAEKIIRLWESETKETP